MTEQNPRRRQKRRRRDERHKNQRVLFYAGVKKDGAPRAWTLQEVLATSLCATLVLLTTYWVFQWLLEFDFGFGK